MAALLDALSIGQEQTFFEVLQGNLMMSIHFRIGLNFNG